MLYNVNIAVTVWQNYGLTSISFEDIMSDQATVNYERFTIHALESFFRSSTWEELQRNFFLTNCPRFRNFNSIYSYELASSLSEIDIQMHFVHQDFITLVEGEISKQFSCMGTNEVRFLQLLEENLQSTDETVQRLYLELMKYRNFPEFGRMMNDKFIELYGISSIVPSTSSPVVLTSSIKVCRVLWDIENIQVNPSVGGLRTVMLLQEFLKKKGITGEGIDTRISAFLNPFNKSITKKVIEELNKASVELICASAKREDSDRKLGIRINQEMQLLNPACTTFVIISSDQDFRQHIQLLSNAAYKVIVIHEAKNDNWKNALEMHATAGYEWSKVMSTEVVADSAGSSGTLPTHITANLVQSYTHTDHIGAQETTHDPTSKSIISTGLGPAPVRDPAREGRAVGWRVAVCQRWASAFGFLLVDVSRPAVGSDFTLASPRLLLRADIRIDRKGSKERDADKNRGGGDAAPGTATAGTATALEAAHRGANPSELVRVYVHNSALAYKEEAQAQRMLRAGEYVLVLVELDAKGPRAAVVKDLIAARPNASKNSAVRTDSADS